MAKNVKRVQSNRVENEIQHNTDRGIQKAKSEGIQGGRCIEGVSVSTSVKKVAHKLGRKPIGAFQVRSDVPVNTSIKINNDGTISVTGSSDATVDLWVF